DPPGCAWQPPAWRRDDCGARSRLPHSEPGDRAPGLGIAGVRMTEWRLPAAIDAIVAALQGLGVQVWDGPIVSGDYDDAIYIGFDGDYGGEELAATTVQTWAGIGQRKRDEDHTITCAVVVLLGNESTSWKPARDKVAALLDAVGQALRNDATLGPAVGQ